jgi:hypothetical protein
MVDERHAMSDQLFRVFAAPSDPTRRDLVARLTDGDATVAEVIDRFYTSDVFLRTWDLARATGQDETLDPEACAGMLAGMQPLEELIRSSGQYGPAVPVPDDAAAQTRLLGFIGSSPDWTPAARR